MTRRPATDRLLRVLATLVLATLVAGCRSHGVPTSVYGTLADGRAAHTFTLTNDNGMTAVLTDFGATLVSLHAPDRDGNMADVTLGYDTLDGWVNDGSYMGATAGRYANRIARGTFVIDEELFILATNNGENHLHGGNVGFNKRLWDAKPFTYDGKTGVTFTYTSPDAEEGYPGELTCWVTYTLTDENELRIDFKAKTTSTTPINLVHHTYWNLTGEVSNTILDHQLVLDADRYCPTDAGGIPNAGLVAVAGTPFDFRTAHAIGERIDGDHEQLDNGKGYDHSWAVNGEAGELRRAAELFDPATGRVMEIWTDQPAIQFYTGNYLDAAPGKNGEPMNHRTGLCLETQVFPDSPQPARTLQRLPPARRHLPPRHGAQVQHAVAAEFSPQSAQKTQSKKKQPTKPALGLHPPLLICAIREIRGHSPPFLRVLCALCGESPPPLANPRPCGTILT